MPVGDVQAYSGLNAQQLQGLTSEKEVDQGDSLKHVLQKMANKTEESKKAEAKGDLKTVETKLDSKVESLFKGLEQGKSGEVGKNALQTFKDAALSKLTNNQAKQTFGEATTRSPQAGFNAASSFQKTSSLPGAETALGSTGLASEALVVTTQAAGKGDKALAEVEGVLGQFVEAFGQNNDATDSAKKKMLGKAVANPKGEDTAAAMAWGKSKQLKLQNSSAQDALANIKDPKKFAETFKGLEKFAGDPKLLGSKLGSNDMKTVFSNVTKAAVGGENLSKSLEAQEKILFTPNKLHNMNMETLGKIQAAVGRAPQNADGVAKSLGQVRDSRLPKFAQKLATKGTNPEQVAQAIADCKTREIAYPAIEPFNPDDPQPQKRTIAFKAKWGRVAQQIDKHNANVAKGLNKCKCMKDLNELDVPRGFGPIIGDAKNPEELAKKTGCTVDEAKYIFELSERCETYKSEDLALSKNLSTKRRALRGKPDTRAHAKEKRTSVAGLPAKMTISLSDEAQSASFKEFSKLVGKGTSKTPTPSGEVAASATAATAAPTAEEVAARNTQTMRPSGKTLSVGGKQQWGNMSVSLGLDREVQQKKLAQKLENASTSLKNDPTKLSKGPMIGRASDFVALSQIVEQKTSWVQLSPAVKATLRNVQITPNILESWYSGQNRIYSSLQAKPWGELTEIQQKSAMLLGIAEENWNALASVLSTNLKTPTALRNKVTVHNTREVISKGRA